jgi:tetratricopeptide (TPR) repeat protein
VYLAEGKVNQAKETAERAVRVTAGQPDDTLRVAQAENALATVLMARGGATRAETIERKVSNDLRGAGATATQEYVDALANLGTAHLRMADYRQADLDLRQAEAAALSVDGANHPSTATIWNNLAQTHAAQGDWKDAEKLFQKAIATWRSSVGPAHPDLASGLSNLATLYQNRKRYSEAEKLFKQAIEIDEAALGADSLKAANDWDNLGALAAIRHRYNDAESAIAKGLAIADKSAGFAHPDTGRIAVNLALVYYSEGKYAEASGMFSRVLPVREQLLGSNSAEMAVILRAYAVSLKAVHDYVGAEKAELRATRIATHNAL